MYQKKSTSKNHLSLSKAKLTNRTSCKFLNFITRTIYNFSSQFSLLLMKSISLVSKTEASEACKTTGMKILSR